MPSWSRQPWQQADEIVEADRAGGATHQEVVLDLGIETAPVPGPFVRSRLTEIKARCAGGGLTGSLAPAGPSWNMVTTHRPSGLGSTIRSPPRVATAGGIFVAAAAGSTNVSMLVTEGVRLGVVEAVGRGRDEMIDRGVADDAGSCHVLQYAGLEQRVLDAPAGRFTQGSTTVLAGSQSC